MIRHLRAELYRKAIGFHAMLIPWLLASFVVYGAALVFSRGLGADAERAILSLACWSGALASSSSVCGEITRARRDATIALRIGDGLQSSFLPNWACAAATETLFGAAILPVLLLLALVLTGNRVDVPTLTAAYAAGALCGACIAPAAWALALFVSTPELISAGLGITFFCLTSFTRADAHAPVARALGSVNPLAPVLGLGPQGLLVWC